LLNRLFENQQTLASLNCFVDPAIFYKKP